MSGLGRSVFNGRGNHESHNILLGIRRWEIDIPPSIWRPSFNSFQVDTELTFLFFRNNYALLYPPWQVRTESSISHGRQPGAAALFIAFAAEWRNCHPKIVESPLDYGGGTVATQ
jgi:hypothetical protein